MTSWWVGLLCLMGCGLGLAASPAGSQAAGLVPQVRSLGNGWVEAAGEAQVVNVTPEEAKRRALQQARERAVAYALGVDVRAATYLRNEEGRDDAFLSLSEQTSAGRIVEERDATWLQYTIPADPLPITVYRVRIQVRAVPDQGLPDPGFQVRMWLNKAEFRPGESMRIEVTASKPCYVTVLCLTAMDTVVVLLPHQHRADRFVAPGDTLRLPDAVEQAMGIGYQVVLPSGMDRAVEWIKVVATMEPQPFGLGLEKVSIFNQVPTRQAALLELMRWLVQIPRNQRAEALAVYEVSRGV